MTLPAPADPASYLLDPRLVALDLDGTVLHWDGSMTSRVRSSVRRVLDSGRHVVLATGRSLLATLPVAESLGISSGYAVCSNGAVTVRLDPSLADGYEVVDTVTFDPRPALELLREHLPQAIYAVEDLGVGFRLTAPFPDGELVGELHYVPFESLVDGQVTRVVVRSPEHTPEEFVSLTRSIGLHGVEYSVGWSAWLDLAPDGVDKASALAKVASRLGVSAASATAVGDGRNDVGMLRWAGYGVAMGNAPAEVQAVADAVTGPVTEDGLAAYLDSLPS